MQDYNHLAAKKDASLVRRGYLYEWGGIECFFLLWLMRDRLV